MIHYSTDVRNHLPRDETSHLPIQKFTGVNVAPRLATFHTFGYYVYQLRTELQNGKKIPKWDRRCHVGLYLGNSPRHSRSISNVLNLQTKRFLPQFHVQHDDFFETISSQTTTSAQWKMLAGFKTMKHTIKDRKQHVPPPTNIYHFSTTSRYFTPGSKMVNR